MKLVGVVTTRAIRLFPVFIEGGKVIDLAGAARNLEAKYGFLQGPRTVAEFDVGNGIVFHRGLFDGAHVIDKFTVFRDGVVCDGTMDSHVADAFIDNVIEFICQEYGLPGPEPSTVLRAYMSAIDIQMDVDLRKALPGFEEFCNRVVSTIRSYGQQTPEFSAQVLGFHGDLTTQPSGGPPSFSIERRQGQSYEEGRYFSKAPLATSHHVDLLGDLERILMGMSKR